MARGQLIGESLLPGRGLRGVTTRLLGVTRVQPPVDNLDPRQPRLWTFIGFEIDDGDAQQMADLLSDVLDGNFPWYCNFATADEMWVVFGGAQFHYQHGDAEGRELAVRYARRLGVPEPQLDWEQAR